MDGLKRMPLVVIPKRRKHKDYVSRRRNPQLLISLRKCSSDPCLYRSYNNWSKLCFNDNKSEHISSPVTSQALTASISKEQQLIKPETTDNKKKVSLIPSSPRSGRKVLDRVNAIQQPKVVESEVVSKEDVLMKKSISKKPTNNEDVNKLKVTQKQPESQTNLERKASAVKKRRAEEFAQIKKELLESAKLPQLSSIPKNKEASDDAKAKKTINAVAAAFSNAENQAVSTKQPTAASNAEKPPPSPLSGRRRFNNESNRLGHPSTQLTTSNIKLKNVPPAQAINVTPSPSEFVTPAEPSPSIEKSTLEEKSSEKSGQPTNRPNHSLAVPPESPQTSRPKKFVDPALAERLQLDPHVLAKIDRIISGGGKKMTVVSIFICLGMSKANFSDQIVIYLVRPSSFTSLKQSWRPICLGCCIAKCLFV